MSDIVSKWILHRLGTIVDMTPEHFALRTANGLLLAQILQSYEIITKDELNLLSDLDHVQDCYDNFKLINVWLSGLSLSVGDDDLYEIVHGVGFASLHLFFQVFLEVKDKTKLDFLTANELNSQLASGPTRFDVNPVNDSQLNLHREGLCEPFLTGGDVYHWYKDRMEGLQTRCKEARDEYIHAIKNKGKSFPIDQEVHESGFVLARSLYCTPLDVVDDYDQDSLDERTYEELVHEQKQAQGLLPLEPTSKAVKTIMNKLHGKSKVRQENRILKNQLHQEIVNEFERKINDSKSNSEDRVLVNIFLKQSLYEKELVTKLGEVKMQKECMAQNKHRQCESLNKLKDQEFLQALLLKDKELKEKKLTYYLEQERVLQLHRKVWQERLRLKAKRHQTLCSDTVKDLVDISMKLSEFKKRFGRQPNERELNDIKRAFVTGKSTFDICDPLINIIKDPSGEIPETIIAEETARQDAIDQQEFDGYMQYESPWQLSCVNFNNAIEQTSCALNVLGYVVHKALETKYPTVPLWEKPNFPDATVRVCVNGLNDTTIVPKLRNLLVEREIKVIELKQVVDFCVDAYRQESKREYEEDNNVAVKKGQSKPSRRKKGEKSGKKTNNAIMEDNNSPATKPLTQNKLVQTPLKYPCEEIRYSASALLGKAARELLDDGLPLGDFLLINMFVEYLKSFPLLKGWVLINYPTTFEQAVVLEEALTGDKLLASSIQTSAHMSLTDIIEPLDHSLLENSDSKRVSRLLPNPVVAESAKVCDTILTAYVRIRKLSDDDKSGDSAGIIGQDADALDRFYSEAGANYSMYYKEFDFVAVKHLGKLIIGDYSLPFKSSAELFGNVNVDSRPAKGIQSTKVGEQVRKPSSGSNSANGKARDRQAKGGKAKAIAQEDKDVKVPTQDEGTTIVTDAADIELPHAGQLGWEYSDVEGPEELMIALATLWETVEENYINDLKQLFFMKRLHMDAFMPFARYVKDIMKKTVHRPDYKGFYLMKFQKGFNAFDADFRKDDEFKLEMHCRVEDFKERLAEMCDMTMMESEHLRCRLINADWASCQIGALINDYINMMQIEMARFMQSLYLMNNYCLGALDEAPVDYDAYREETLPKCREINPEIINTMLRDRAATVDLAYFDQLVASVVQKANGSVKRLVALAASSIEKTKDSLVANQKPRSKAGSPKSKASKDTKKTLPLDSGLMKRKFDKLLDEWQCAVKGETLRISLRVDSLRYNALKSVEESLRALQQVFHQVYDDVRGKYQDDMTNVEAVCKVFRSAVEHEQPVQKQLIFDRHKFHINPDINLFDNPAVMGEKSKEVVEDGAFTIAQLSKIADILLDLSPAGYIPKATFLFVLQDVVWMGSEDLCPTLWSKLTPKSLRQVVDSLYDELEYVYWRDFIVYNLRIAYPTERELLMSRRALRECDPDATELVQDYQFFACKLWFEYSFKQIDSNQILDIKRLLFKLYRIKNYGLNYTAMLLDFCKSDSSVEGFAKALGLSIGKMVCWDMDVGRIFKEEYLRSRCEHEEDVKRRDDERAACYKAAREEVVRLVDYVVKINDEAVIEDVVTEELEDSTTSFRCEEFDKENGETFIKLYKQLPDNVGTDSNGFSEIHFFLSLDPLITVITAALPWHSRVKEVGDLTYWETAAQVYEKCKNPDFNGAVLAHECLNSLLFLDLLSRTKKFNIIDPVGVVNDVLDRSDKNVL